MPYKSDKQRKSECILFVGALDDQGYGKVWNGRIMTQAHRLAYGDVPEGLEIHHTCEVKACINPEHLVAVTHADHRKLHLLTHCRKGHSLDDAYVRPNGVRQCRPCRNAAKRRSYRRKRAVQV